jgi:flagellar motor protein MotB
MDEENILDFNFWPSFSDLMLSLVLILVLVLFLVSAVLNVGTVNLSHVEKNQKEFIATIGSAFGVSPEKSEKEKELYIISVSPGIEGDIFIKNEPTVQKITFSGNILFPPDEVELNDRGRKVLSMVGDILSKNLKLIREIQIQGHADPLPTKYGTNMLLASNRAISVFNYLKDVLKIDPAQHLMSITSFGEYKPVQRSDDEKNYNWETIEKIDNKTDELKSRNRRIELLLFYYY